MKFTSQNKQLTFDLFRSSLDELDKTNRWVMLGDLLPWAEIEKRYNSKLNNQVKGAIECSFGTGKRIYRADNIRAKLPETARCWTGMCYFVKNVMKFLKELCHALNEIWHTLRLIASLEGIIRNPLVTVKYLFSGL